ncbi:MAG TPA: FAD-dependent oxidoreductase, partial [Bacillota bacterium]|nr:FAD-dependent oxidoreductase [Bacillota bacterium]
MHEAESINRIESEKESAAGQVNTGFHFGQADTGFHAGQYHTGFHVKTNCGCHQYDFSCRFLINSAGLSSDAVCRMLGIYDYRISPCRGEYHILSKDVCKTPSDDRHIHIPRDPGFPVHHRGIDVPLYPAPNFSEGGLGVHLTPTIEGNIMIGPGSEYLDDPDESDEKYATTKEMMDSLLDEGLMLLSLVSDPKSSDNNICSTKSDPSGNDETGAKSDPSGNDEAGSKPLLSTNSEADTKPDSSTNSKPITKDDIIKSFSGIRPKLTSKEKGGFADFVIENKDGFIILTGIESPGLTASIPIAKMVSAMVDDIIAGSSSGTSTEQNDFCSSEMETADPSKTQDTPCEAETSPLNSRKDSKICGSGEPGSTRIICSC